MVEYSDLKNEDKILLEVERQENLTAGDIMLLLNNCCLPYASTILKETWAKGMLKRKKERKKKGGYRYRYSLSVKGEKVVEWLHKRGY